MKIRSLAAAAFAASLSVTCHAQLLISEFFTNPTGNDSPFEWVELIATETINFSVTPYTVVFSDQSGGRYGTNGWVTGGRVSYGFEITSGVVARGDVVYVGGSSMSPVGTKLRTINTATTAGDGFGVLNADGVLGNGGNVPEGLAVFNTSVANLTGSFRPIDAIFFGNPTGAVFLAQYELPVNDRYAGGKVDANSFFAPDPGGNATVLATGTFNTDSGTWDSIRNWSLGTATDGLSGVTLTPVPEPSTLTLALLGGALSAIYCSRRKR